MMSNPIELPNGTTIEKGTDGTWHIKSWVTGEVRDKDGQIIEVDELLKDVPKMIEDGGKVHLGHSDTPLGPITDVQKQMRTYNGKEIKAIQASWELKDNRKYKKWVQGEMEKGEYPELSIKAYAFGKKEFKDDADGVLTEYPKELEWTGFALCKTGKNPTTGHIDINGVAIEKSDDGKLGNSPEFQAVVIKMITDDGLSYKQAMEAAKEVYTDEIAKACTEGRDGKPKTEKERKETHKDKYGNESTPPRGTGKDKEVKKGDIEMSKELEAMEKELADLKKASKESTASLEKSVEDLKTELAKEQEKSKGLEMTIEKGNGEPPVVVKKEDVPVALSKEDVQELIKEDRATFLEDITKEGEPRDKLLKSMGLLKAGETPAGLPTLVKSAPTDDELDSLNVMLAKAKNRQTNANMGEITAYEKAVKEATGEPTPEGE